MDDCMAIGANRAQVSDRIDFVFSSDIGKPFQMVHMNKAFADAAISPLEVEPADLACATVTSKTMLSSLDIALIGVDRDGAD
jgi:hypothetical protein